MQVAPAPEAPQPKGTTTIFGAGPLDFNLSSSGLALTGKTNYASELRAFIDKLNALVGLLPDKPEPSSPQDIEDLIG